MDIVVRGVVLYVFVVFLLRVIGRRELSSLSAIDLVLLIVLGDAIQQGLTQDDYSVTGALIAVSTIALMQLGSSYLSFRSSRMRTVLEGDPMVVVQDGKPVARNLRRLRMTTDELAEEARGQGSASLNEVRWAIAEASGTVSFIQEG